MKIAAPNIYRGHARAWLYKEMMAAEGAKDLSYVRGDRLRSEGKRKEPRASGTNPKPTKRAPIREAARDIRIKNGSTPPVPRGKKNISQEEAPIW